MHYFGGKQRIAKHIIPVLESLRKPDQTFLEPFVGGANIITKMTGPRIASDIHEDLILLWKALQDDNFDLPTNVTLEEYQAIRKEPPSALRAFIGFGLSYAGKYFGGYARGGTDSKGNPRNYAANARNSLMKKRLGLKDVEFHCKSYDEWNPVDWLIYVDPPYMGTTKIHGKSFDTEKFWNVMREWSKTNTVIISEYNAPPDFNCILEIPTKTDIRTKANGKELRIEKLFRHSDH